MENSIELKQNANSENAQTVSEASKNLKERYELQAKVKK